MENCTHHLCCRLKSTQLLFLASRFYQISKSMNLDYLKMGAFLQRWIVARMISAFPPCQQHSAKRWQCVFWINQAEHHPLKSWACEERCKKYLRSTCIHRMASS